MKGRAGLPAVGCMTMLGLNLARPVPYTSWLDVLPTTSITTPKKRPAALTTSFSSTASREPVQRSTWQPLDDCLRSNGAMDSFRSLLDQSVLAFATPEPKDEGITSSIERLQIPCRLDKNTPQLMDCPLTASMQIPDLADCVHGGAHQNDGSVTAPAREKTSSLTISSSLLIDEGAMVPFSAMLPDHLLSTQVDDMPRPNNDTLPVLDALPLHYGSVGSGSISTQANDTRSLTVGTPSYDHGGRTSPQSSTMTGGYFSSLCDSPSSSRRTSWATSISAHHRDEDGGQAGFDCEKLALEFDQNMDEIELIHDYHHYSQLIDLGDAQNRRDKDFVAQQPEHEGDNEEITTPETAHSVGSALTFEASGGIVSDDTTAPTTEATLSPQEEGKEPDTQSDPDSDIQCSLPSTPAESAAWAHSRCGADPETAKLKILSDDRGREYVLYHDCFHCVPIELAPEFTSMSQEDDDDENYDDDFDFDGCEGAGEAGDQAGDGDKALGTIPEEENEG